MCLRRSAVRSLWPMCGSEPEGPSAEPGRRWRTVRTKRPHMGSAESRGPMPKQSAGSGMTGHHRRTMFLAKQTCIGLAAKTDPTYREHMPVALGSRTGRTTVSVIGFCAGRSEQAEPTPLFSRSR
jgi:hypothetical protein